MILGFLPSTGLLLLARTAMAYILHHRLLLFLLHHQLEHDFVMGSEKGCICCTYCIERPSWPGVQK